MSMFLTSNDWKWRLVRTVVQGVIGVAVADIDVLVGSFVLDASMKAVVVALVMAVFSPIMAELGRAGSDGDGGDTDGDAEGTTGKHAAVA